MNIKELENKHLESLDNYKGTIETKAKEATKLSIEFTKDKIKGLLQFGMKSEQEFSIRMVPEFLLRELLKELQEEYKKL